MSPRSLREEGLLVRGLLRARVRRRELARWLKKWWRNTPRERVRQQTLALWLKERWRNTERKEPGV